jgi:sortase (surface protein transpeptidase)
VQARVRAQPAETPAEPSPSIQGLRISLPRLGIDLPLDTGDIGRDVPRSGFAGRTPEAVALVFPGTNIPGRGGNTYVYAHARKGMFLTLWDVRVDDAVFVVRDDRSVVRAYRITLVLPRVDPSDTGWLDPSGPERLTLQTSTGPRPEDPRFIAVAYPIDTATGTTARQQERD